MKKYWLMFLGLFVIGCAEIEFDPEKYQKYSAQALLDLGDQQFKKGEYLDAIKYYETLDALYPFEAETKIGQLKIIDAYYLENNYDLVLASTGRFIRLYPEDKILDKVYYYRGLAHLEKGRTLGQRLFRSKLSRIDLDGFRLAFQDFNMVVSKYSDSEFVEDSRKKMLFIRNVLAEKELDIAKFYFERGAYIAAINRVRVLLKEYDGALQIKEGLILMEKAYQKLNLPKEAGLVHRLLELNFPGQ